MTALKWTAAALVALLAFPAHAHRSVATCYVAGANLNEAIVRAGWADDL